MKTTAAIAATASFVVSMAIALPAAIGSDTHYTVRCVDPTGIPEVARSYDSGTVERAGGKAHAIELFKQQHPGGHCSVARSHDHRR